MDRKRTRNDKGSSWSIKAFDMFGSPVAFNINGDEQYKTVIGCFWSIIMIVSLSWAFGWYFTTFLKGSDVEVTTEIAIQDEYPLIDFARIGFFFSVSATKDNKLKRIEELSNVLKFEASQRGFDSKLVNGERSNPVERSPTNIPFGPCRSGGKTNSVGGKSLEGKSSLATSDRAWCSFVNPSKNQTMFVQGNEDSDVYAFVKLKILPCDDTSPDCLFYYLKTPTAEEGGTQEQCQRFKNEVALQATQQSEYYYGPDDECDCSINGRGGTTNWKKRCDASVRLIREAITEQIGRIQFTFNYVEAAIKPENFEEPFAYTMKSTIKLYGSIASTKVANIYFRETMVNTDVGVFSEIFDVKSSVTFDSVLTDFLDRGAGKVDKQLGYGGEVEEIASSFMEFNLYSSNNQIIFTRKYTKILDVFANVGGVAEVIGFVIVFFYAWYNGIRMEQKLLNYGVLNKSKKKKGEKDSKYGNHSEDWEKSRYFNFWDLLRFGMIEKGMGFMFKKDKKFELYEETKETFEKRTDIINIMKAVSDVDTIKDAILQQYHIRLMPYLSNQKDDGDGDVLAMSVNEAINRLHRENKEESLISKKMDEYLKLHLPGQILAGRPESLDLGTLPAPAMEFINVKPRESKIHTPSFNEKKKSKIVMNRGKLKRHTGKKKNKSLF